MVRISSLLVLLCGGTLLTGCKDKAEDSAGDGAWRPDVVCPGDAGCESLGDGVLYAGAAALPITPTCFESWDDLNVNGEYERNDEPFFDCGCDRLCAEDDGYPGADEGEEDGTFQAIYIAGFGTNRPVSGIHDDLWSRTVAMRQGDVTVAIVSVDLIGVFYNEVEKIRQDAADAGIDVDHILLSATHNHEGPDSLGQWGRQLGETGYNDDYMAYVRAQVVASVAEAVDALTPATLAVAEADVSTYNTEKGSRNVVYDHRDPKIIDRFVKTAWLTDSSGETIATVVNFGNHPEALGSENSLVTSDYVNATRRGIEEGIVYPDSEVPGVGGVCVYVSAAVGGMMSPLRIEVTDGSGETYSESGFDKADALGNVMAELVLGSLASAEVAESPELALRARTFQLPIDNIAFQAAFLLDMFRRPVYGVDTADLAFDDDNVPLLLTEVDLLDVGPIRMLSIPGELLPELALGGYDESEGHPFTPLETLVDADNPNPPDLSAAPEGPYLFERMGGQYNWIIGLGNDEVGYIVPAYNYKIHESTPYLQEPDGDHYEETNSLGPQTTPLIEAAVIELMEWSP
ncbi:MAG: hypothetical protein ACI8RZ_004481 [Myxococcota bacterium]|jgi:hypothetical protein